MGIDKAASKDLRKVAANTARDIALALRLASRLASAICSIVPSVSSAAAETDSALPTICRALVVMLSIAVESSSDCCERTFALQLSSSPLAPS